MIEPYRVVVFLQEDHWVAQLLEADVAANGDSVFTAVVNLGRVLDERDCLTDPPHARPADVDRRVVVAQPYERSIAIVIDGIWNNPGAVGLGTMPLGLARHADVRVIPALTTTEYRCEDHGRFLHLTTGAVVPTKGDPGLCPQCEEPAAFVSRRVE